MTTPALPVLTFPEEVAEFVRECYANASVILEYGSGGSTFLAAGQPGKIITSIESDPAWANRMREIANAHSLPSPPLVIHADVGPVGLWARPLDHLRLESFIGYAQDIWFGPSFKHPDVILIDGRFRAACFMIAYLMATKPVRILIDDYKKRPQYHVIERLCAPTKFVGRMVVFDFVPESRLSVTPWLLVATFFDAVCSFKVGVAPPRRRIKDRFRAWRRARSQASDLTADSVAQIQDPAAMVRKSLGLPRDRQ